MLRNLLTLTARVSLTAALSLALAVGGVLLADATAGATGVVTVSLVGTFAGVSSTGEVLGVAQGVSAKGKIGRPFSFSAACSTGGAPSACGPIQWNFGNNVIHGGGDQISEGYATSGTFTVSATVNTTSYAVGQIEVLVSPYYADVQAGVTSRAAWALGASGLATTCGDGLYCPAPNATSGPAETIGTTVAKASSNPIATLSLLSTAGVWVGQSLTLGNETTTVSGVSGSTVNVSPALGEAATKGEAVTLFPALASPLVNGVTGQSCLAGPGACGLPASYFSKAGCNQACLTGLQGAGYVTTASAPELVYNPTNCGAGYAAQHLKSGWQEAVGEPAGCESRGEFLSLLVNLAGGSSEARKSPCSDSADALAREGAELGLTRPLVEASGRCYLSGPLSKQVAYAMLGILRGSKATGPMSGFSDMAGNGDDAVIGSLLATGTPVVGSTVCPLGVGTCFNPTVGLTKGEAGQLAASDLLGGARVAGGTTVGVSYRSGELVATVHPGVGEPIGTLAVTLTSGATRCVRDVRIGRAAEDVTCPLKSSTVGRIATVRVTGGWGVAVAAAYLKGS
jgi:hypothetical protein